MRQKRLRSIVFLLGLAVLAAGAAFTSTPPASGSSCASYLISVEPSSVTEDGVPAALPASKGDFVYLSGKTDALQLNAHIANAYWREDYHVASVAPCP